MDFWEAIEKRHSVRAFKDAPVSREQIERLLHAASHAPSALNAQPWRFHVAQGASRSAVGKLVAQCTAHLAEYMDILGPDHYERALIWYSSLGNAPVVIGVSMPECESEYENANALISIGCATQNLQLAVTAEGLGCCLITFARWVQAELEEALQVDGDRCIVALLAVGHPAGPAVDHEPPRDDIATWLD